MAISSQTRYDGLGVFIAKGLVKLSPVFLSDFVMIKAIMDLYDELKSGGLCIKFPTKRALKNF